MKTADLKPCPFCGGRDLTITGMRDPLWPLFPAEVICHKCEAAVVFAYVSTIERAKQIAMEQWNRRANEEAIKDDPHT